jgi:hypothetical protein
MARVKRRLLSTSDGVNSGGAALRLRLQAGSSCALNLQYSATLRMRENGYAGVIVGDSKVSTDVLDSGSQ